MSNSPEAERLALDFLKGKENPFDRLARPQRLDDFLDLDAPELLAGDRRLLLQIIDHYRVEVYTRAADLRPTRVVTVLGDRGAGKTHLLQSLAYRADGKSQLLVMPSFYDHHLPFEEFLLAQVMATLATDDEVYRSRPIEDLAVALTRRLLRQALRALGPTERMFARPLSSWQRFVHLFGRGASACKPYAHVIAALDAGTVTPRLADLVERHGLDAPLCFRLIQGHLRLYEQGPDLLAALRRKLYAALAQSALLGQNEPLDRLLEGDYADSDSSPTTRVETVARMLHAVIEACALVRQPIVVAFDNLERLFSPRNEFDGNVVRVFFNNLAQAVDNTRGILIYLFAESGLFEQAARHMDEFARHRLLQGVPIYGRGPINLVRLNPPAASDVRTLAANRLRKTLAGCPAAAELSELFPFDEASLKVDTIEREPVRSSLLRLRDLYSARVYEQAVPEPKSEGVAWESLLESTWREQLQAAAAKLESGLVGQLPILHAGLASLLQPLLPLALDAWLVTEIQQSASVGDHPNYGMVSLLKAFGKNGDRHGVLPSQSSFFPNAITSAHPPPGANGSPLTMGVGLLTAKGTGMPRDLRAKLDFFRRPRRGDRLLVLWPTPSDRDNLVEALPAATRAVWDGSRHKSNVTLRRIANDELCMLLAATGWFNALAGAADTPPPAEAVQSFLKEKCQTLFQLVAPPSAQLAGVVTDED